MTSVVCTNCGARLDVDGSTPTPICAFCKTRNVLPEDVWQRVRPQVIAQPIVVAPEPPPAQTDLSTKLILVFGAVGSIVAAVVVMVMSKSTPPSQPAPTPVASVGAACNGTESACASDGKALLRCDGSKLVVALACKGANGCRVIDQGRSVNCDYTRADENDPCNMTDSTCSSDGKSELRCDGAKFVLSSACNGPGGCSVSPSKDGFTLTCDDHMAAPDAPCLEDGRVACSLDTKSFLRCTRGHFTAVKACAKGCTLKRDPLTETTDIACQ